MADGHIITAIDALEKKIKLPDELFLYIISFIGYIYKDKNISILHPRDIGKGVLIGAWHDQDNYKIFKAPYFSPPVALDNLTDNSKILSLYGEINTEMVFIRVDPDNTYVFSSMISRTSHYQNTYVLSSMSSRTSYENSLYRENLINNSRKTITEYLKVIKENAEFEKNVPNDRQIWYNLYSSKSLDFPILHNFHFMPKFPFHKCRINMASEIHVDISLIPNYFV